MVISRNQKFGTGAFLPIQILIKAGHLSTTLLIIGFMNRKRIVETVQLMNKTFVL